MAIQRVLYVALAKTVAPVPVDGEHTPLSVDPSDAGLRVHVMNGGVGGGGTEYTEGNTDATITGQAILWEDAADTLRAVSAAKPLPVNVVAGSGGNGAAGNTGAAVPSQASYTGARVGGNLQGVEGFDLDTGAGTQYVLGISLRKSADGGSVEAGTLADPIRTDPTGTTAQPVTDAGGSLTVDANNLDIRDLTHTADSVRAVVNTAKDGSGTYYNPIVDADGHLQVDVLTGGGGGTQYTEDAPAAADPVGNMGMAVRADSLAAVTSLDGDNIALRATNKGELYVKQSDAVPVTDNGGSLTVDGSVSLAAALPAGTNNIGDVDVLSLPALPAGTNNIGDVDVLSVPADPFGANADASSATGSISAKLRFLAAGIAGMTSLPAGTNNIGDVDVLSLPALPAGNNNIGDVDAIQSGTWTVQPGNTQNTTEWLVSDRPQTSGGLSKFHLVSAASTNASNIKASAGQVYAIVAFNLNASARYLKFHNTSGTPTAGSGVTDTFLIPGNTAGAGLVINFDKGIAFSTGIGITLVTGITDADANAVAASEIVLQVYYK